MDIQEALDIVRKLAKGDYPATAPGSEDSQIVVALNRAAQALEFQQQRERTRASLPANAGKPWSKAEDAQICDEVRRGVNFEEIARIHCRTAGSIVARLIFLGKISAGRPPEKSLR